MRIIFHHIIFPLLIIVSFACSTPQKDELFDELKRETPDLEEIRESIADGTDEHGNTALLLATYKGHKEIIEYLIYKGIDVNVQNLYGFTPLHIAASEGDFEIAKILVDAGATITKENHDGETALALALKESNWKMFDLLCSWVPSGGNEVTSNSGLEGTTWILEEDDGDRYSIAFKFGGRFAFHNYKYNNSYDDNNDTWKVQGNTIQMSYNDGYMIKKGTISGIRMEGSYRNRQGLTGTWKAIRVASQNLHKELKRIRY